MPIREILRIALNALRVNKLRSIAATVHTARRRGVNGATCVACGMCAAACSIDPASSRGMN